MENVIPFQINRLFYIYGVDDSKRGGHRHHKTIQAAICLQGQCKIYSNNGKGHQEIFNLNKPFKCLILEPCDWHEMFDFTPNAIFKQNIKHEFNIPANKKILFVSTSFLNEKRKGIKILYEALKSIVRNDFILLIAGNTDLDIFCEHTNLGYFKENELVKAY